VDGIGLLGVAVAKGFSFLTTGVLSVEAAAVVYASSLRLGGGLLAGARVVLEVVELQAEIGFSAVLAEGFLSLRLQILVSPKHIVGYREV